MAQKEKVIYRFRISLLGIEPEIWRLIEVPEKYTFWDLHVAIQDAMGWWDSHLHEFRLPGAGRKAPRPIGIPLEPMDDEEEYTPGWVVMLGEVFSRPGDVIGYQYDFGDNWCHEVKLLALELAREDIKYPRCVAGERACPPEDCGGIGGYYGNLKILADPEHEEYEETVHWLGGRGPDGAVIYRPEVFEPTSVRFSSPRKRLKNMLNDEPYP